MYHTRMCDTLLDLKILKAQLSNLFAQVLCRQELYDGKAANTAFFLEGEKRANAKSVSSTSSSWGAPKREPESLSSVRSDVAEAPLARSSSRGRVRQNDAMAGGAEEAPLARSSRSRVHENVMNSAEEAPLARFSGSSRVRESDLITNVAEEAPLARSRGRVRENDAMTGGVKEAPLVRGSRSQSSRVRENDVINDSTQSRSRVPQNTEVSLNSRQIGDGVDRDRAASRTRESDLLNDVRAAQSRIREASPFTKSSNTNDFPPPTNKPVGFLF